MAAQNMAGAIPGKKSFALFNELLEEMQEVTKADGHKVVRNGGRDFTRAALKVTRRAKAKAFKYEAIERLDGSIYFKPLGKQPVKGAGYAKSGWIAVMHSLGINVKLKKKASKSYIKELPFISVAQLKADSQIRNFDPKTGNAMAFGSDETPAVLLNNKIPYIGILDKQDRIVNRAMSITVNKMEKRLAKMAKRMQRDFIV